MEPVHQKNGSDGGIDAISNRRATRSARMRLEISESRTSSAPLCRHRPHRSTGAKLGGQLIAKNPLPRSARFSPDLVGSLR